ncbi:NAD(P)H-hydrate dehydratase [Candidatus Marinamargulisbacteria bacterium SCGC AG-414-C22]|nr:NAD(P)H-hydrate dehydratase [Candidatus Marinamargulisbacteria bacterium SCGC AG-414-C22]
MDIDALKQQLINRHSNTHKYNYGHVGIVAGSKHMIGAGILVAQAALKTGAGLVTLMTVDSVEDPINIRYPEIMVLALPSSDDGQITSQAELKIKQYCIDRNVTTLAIGPGLGQGRDMKTLINKIAFQIAVPLQLPCVIDADAITQLATDQWDDIIPESWVFTPHAGEFKQLCQPINIAYSDQQRLKCATQAQSWIKQILVLKGYETIIKKNNNYYTNDTGNPGMATAGSGDILTGVIASLYAQGLTAYEAAVLGVYIHGKAGDAAYQKEGIGLTATDIVNFLPRVIGES